MAISLWEMSAGFVTLSTMLDEQSPDEDILRSLEAIQGSLETKAVSIVNLIKSLDAEVKVIKDEEDRLSRRRKSKENTAANIRQYIQGAMIQMKLDKIKTPLINISVVNNPPSVYVSNPDIVPGEYMTFIPAQYVPDKKEIAKALKDGVEVKGCELQQKKGLRIR